MHLESSQSIPALLIQKDCNEIYWSVPVSQLESRIKNHRVTWWISHRTSARLSWSKEALSTLLAPSPLMVLWKVLGQLPDPCVLPLHPPLDHSFIYPKGKVDTVAQHAVLPRVRVLWTGHWTKGRFGLSMLLSLSYLKRNGKGVCLLNALPKCQ